MLHQKNYWYIIWLLAKTDFKLRYQGSILGFFWVILKPLFIFLILNFVFSNIFNGGAIYSLNLLLGIMVWNFFSEGTMTGMTSLLQKSHIITKIDLPKSIIVFASTLNVLLTFLFNLIILVVFFVWYGVMPSLLGILATLGYFFLIYGIVLAISLLLSSLFLRFRDLNQIWEVFLTAGFYAAPIIYPITTIPVDLQKYFYLNPLTFVFVRMNEVLFYDNFSFLVENLLYIAGVIVLLLCSYLVFKRSARRAAELV